MAITGEIDLTQGLDFFRHKELPSIIPRVLPWVKEKIGRSSIVAHTGYLSPVNTEEDLSLSSNSRITFTNGYSTTIRMSYNINTISNTSYSDNFDTTIGCMIPYVFIDSESSSKDSWLKFFLGCSLLGSTSVIFNDFKFSLLSISSSITS